MKLKILKLSKFGLHKLLQKQLKGKTWDDYLKNEKQMISKLKTLIKIHYLFCYRLFFIKSSKEIKPKSLLLIRLDAIGDYVLFRNFIEVLKKSEKYKDYSITLLGNIAWKNLQEELDGEFIDNFIWLDRDRFNKDFLYRYQKLQVQYQVVMKLF